MAKIGIITGSTLGGAEYVAEHLSDVLSAQGFEVEVFNQATLADLTAQTQLLVVTSTHGAGELPENLLPVFDELMEARPSLADLAFGVVGLGSSDYDTFCFGAERVEADLRALGARCVCETLKIDVVNVDDQDAAAEAWLPTFIQGLSA